MKHPNTKYCSGWCQRRPSKKQRHLHPPGSCETFPTTSVESTRRAWIFPYLAMMTQLFLLTRGMIIFCHKRGLVERQDFHHSPVVMKPPHSPVVSLQLISAAVMKCYYISQSGNYQYRPSQLLELSLSPGSKKWPPSQVPEAAEWRTQSSAFPRSNEAELLPTLSMLKQCQRRQLKRRFQEPELIS